MIKSETTKGNEFPKLMINLPSEGIVLMISSNGSVGKGMVVRKGNYTSVGDYIENWNMEIFTDYEGSVTLTNTKEGK